MFTELRLSPLVSLKKWEGQFESPLRAQGLIFQEVPSQAFGDGSHPTTRLCAGIVDFICRQEKPRSVLDLGTGTGILARIARARGAREVFATDIDPVALASTEENAALDGFEQGIRISSQLPDFWGPRFDFVIANILEEPLRRLAPSIFRSMRVGGKLLISGFTRAQIPGIVVAFEQAGFSLKSESQLDEWMALLFVRAKDHG